MKVGDKFKIDTYRVSQYKNERVVDEVTILEEPKRNQKKVLVYSPKLQANVLIFKKDLLVLK